MKSKEEMTEVPPETPPREEMRTKKRPTHVLCMPGNRHLSLVICLVNLRFWPANAGYVPTSWPFSSVMMWNTKHTFSLKKAKHKGVLLIYWRQCNLVWFHLQLMDDACITRKHATLTNIHAQVVQCFKVAEHSFHAPLLLSYLWFGACFLQE